MRLNAERFCSPTCERVSCVTSLERESFRAERPQFTMKKGNDLKIMGQRAQLSGTAEFEFNAAIHIHGLIQRIGVNTYSVSLWRSFEEESAVDHFARINSP